MSKIIPCFLEKIQPNETTSAIKETVSHIDMNNLDKAKQTWFLKVMRKDRSNSKEVLIFMVKLKRFFCNMFLNIKIIH